MDEMNKLEMGSYILVVAGALNWAFTGLGMLSQGSRTVYNPIYQLSSLLGTPQLEAIFYVAVGFSALYQIYFGYQVYR